MAGSIAEPNSIAELEIIPGAAANTRVTLVILVAVAIGITLTYLLTGGGTKLFSPHTSLVTVVPDAAGVVVGSEVRLSGIPIGNVTHVTLSGSSDPQHIVRIEMKVDEQFLKNIPSDSQAVVTEDNLLGNQFVSIDEGNSPVPIAENAILASAPVKQAADRADLIKTLQHELQQADDLFDQLASPDTKEGAFLLKSEDYDQVMLRLNAFEKTLHSFSGPDSTVAQALFSSKPYDAVRGYIDQVDHTLESIQKGEGSAGKLFASDVQHDDLLKQLRGLHKSLTDMNASKTGMLHDDAAYRQLQTLLTQTDSMISGLTTGDGSVSKLMRDRQLYDSLNATLIRMQAMLKDLKDHPSDHLRISRRPKK